jgi:hypothetical protein
MSQLEQVGRLAMRVEGDLWVAYYARPGTMKDAVFLGSIQMAIVTADCQAKELFMSIMRDAVTRTIKEVTGITPEWPEDCVRPAPDFDASFWPLETGASDGHRRTAK